MITECSLFHDMFKGKLKNHGILCFYFVLIQASGDHKKLNKQESTGRGRINVIASENTRQVIKCTHIRVSSYVLWR